MLSVQVYPDICPWSSQQFLKCLTVTVHNYCVVMWNEVQKQGSLDVPLVLLRWIHLLVCCAAMLLVQWPSQTHSSAIYTASTVPQMGFSCTHLTNRLFNVAVSYLLIFRVTRHNKNTGWRNIQCSHLKAGMYMYIYIYLFKKKLNRNKMICYWDGCGIRRQLGLMCWNLRQYSLKLQIT